MTPQLELVVTGRGDGTPVTAAAATVPQLFRVVDEPLGGPWVAWVLAGDDAWQEVATDAFGAGAALVVVDSPSPAPPTVLASFGGSPRPVVLVTPRTHAPAVRTFVGRLAAVRANVTWVEAVLVVRGTTLPDTRAVLWDGLVTLAAAGLPVDAIDAFAVAERAVLVDARSAGARVHVTLVQGPGVEPLLRVAAYGSFGSLAVATGDPLVADPGEVLQVGESGALATPTDYRTSRRVALGEVYDAVVHRVATMSPLSAYEREAALVEQAFG